MAGDMQFFNSLWKKGCEKETSNPELSNLLSCAHRMLRTQVYTALLAFSLGLVFAVSNING